MSECPPANRSPAQKESIEKMARAAIEEARMVTPGIQALFGFQLVAAAMVPLAIAICLDIYIIDHLILSSQGISIAEQGSVSGFFVRLASGSSAAACILFGVFAALWFAFPFVLRRRG